MERNPSERIKEIVGSLVDEPEEEDGKTLRPRRGPWSVWTKIAVLALVLFVAGAAWALWTGIQKVGPGTVSAAPVAFAPTLAQGSTVPCTSSCEGVSWSATNGAVTVNIGFTSVTATWAMDTTGATPAPGTVALVPTTITTNAGCGVAPPSPLPSGWVNLGAGTTAVAVPVGSYNYCFYYSALPSVALPTVDIAYASP